MKRRQFQIGADCRTCGTFCGTDLARFLLGANETERDELRRFVDEHKEHDLDDAVIVELGVESEQDIVLTVDRIVRGMLTRGRQRGPVREPTRAEAERGRLPREARPIQSVVPFKTPEGGR
jgi:hypothetical protein